MVTVIDRMLPKPDSGYVRRYLAMARDFPGTPSLFTGRGRGAHLPRGSGAGTVSQRARHAARARVSHSAGQLGWPASHCRPDRNDYRRPASRSPSDGCPLHGQALPCGRNRTGGGVRRLAGAFRACRTGCKIVDIS
ncbi:hypothetical protein MRX96_052232 [Rhipicephalus microplus]